MKNEILIHKNYDLSKIYFNYFIALIPLIMYGIYKNGILLYLNHSISFLGIFKPLLLPLIGAFSGLLVHYVLKKEIKLNPLIIYGLIIGMVVPISTNIIVFILSIIGLLFLSSYLETKFSFNTICFIKLVLVGVLLLFGNYEYASTVELAKDYAFSFIDILFGRGIGGVCSSSIIWIIVGFGYLMFDYYYKKEIPIYAIISYVIVNLISYIFIKDISIVVNNIFSSSAIFAFVFIAPISVYSAATSMGKIIFGVLIGLLTAVLTLFIGTFESPFIAILIVSLLKDFIDKFGGQKKTK